MQKVTANLIVLRGCCYQMFVHLYLSLYLGLPLPGVCLISAIRAVSVRLYVPRGEIKLHSKAIIVTLIITVLFRCIHPFCQSKIRTRTLVINGSAPFYRGSSLSSHRLPAPQLHSPRPYIAVRCAFLLLW